MSRARVASTSEGRARVVRGLSGWGFIQTRAARPACLASVHTVSPNTVQGPRPRCIAGRSECSASSSVAVHAATLELLNRNPRRCGFSHVTKRAARAEVLASALAALGISEHRARAARAVSQYLPSSCTWCSPNLEGDGNSRSTPPARARRRGGGVNREPPLAAPTTATHSERRLVARTSEAPHRSDSRCTL